MKILHVIPSYLPAIFASGPIIPTHALNKELAKNGIEVVVYTINIDGDKTLDVPLNREVVIDGVKVFYFSVTFRPWQYSFAMHRALAKNIKKFDLVHITSVFLSASALGTYYARKFGKPHIISPHGSLMREPLGKKNSLLKKIYIFLIERRNLAGADALHFTVETEKKEYLEAGLPMRKAIIIPNSLGDSAVGADDNEEKIDFRKKNKIALGGKIILFLSRLNWKKGLDTLIPAFVEVVKKKPNAVLVLAGPDDGNYKKEVEEMLRDAKLRENEKNDGRVIFTGMLLGEDKIAALRESDVFVLPSYSENFGMAVIEAMSFGLPVVVTKGVGISGEVETSGAGLVVEKNVNQVAEAILEILENPELAEKMGEQGKKLVKNEFSGDKVAKRFLEEYNKTIANHQNGETKRIGN
ncbi:MAG: Glycosyl transferase group 1 [Candidatus Wolfebacteria bacterium GW2011_GWA1_44_24]|uniref:Glycosyl transferase group 1 n=1 Tax=Candidatus Wolfebacteria bacterium GW2011_GWB1_41_12 TaxID=1619006 RepID=A0A0G0WXL5_9BACT|nr:MAG: Glycosyl transferase group 1 [Candidatus Wolfebacteria bacterium GW2011_GWB1_41_12]KKT56666.1 MAG: Glycosyl transferase group 1 [Candidatus Wolfebacteria bacterium GW2011_GWA1_44_24]